MARGVLDVQDILRTGLNPVLSTGVASTGHVFDNTGHNVYLWVKTTGTTTTVKIITPNLVDGLAIGDLEIIMPDTGDRLIGPFPKALYDTIDTDPDPDIDPAIFIDLTADTGVDLGAFRLPDPSY